MSQASNHDARVQRGNCAVCGLPLADDGRAWQVRTHGDLSLETTCSAYCATQALARSREAARAVPVNIQALRVRR